MNLRSARASALSDRAAVAGSVPVGRVVVVYAPTDAQASSAAAAMPQALDAK